MVIRGGTVVDGSGEELFEADVAISDGRIVEVGKVTGRGRDEFDARNKLVTPGFVDIHTHYDGQITWTDSLTPSSLHGTTTVVMGNCGVGFAPCRPDHHDLLIEVMEGVEDIPGIVMAEGVPWKWERFPEYLNFLAGKKSDVDFATQVPHGPVRVYVMGSRGAAREPATLQDMQAMTKIVKEAVEAGALGFSTARTMIHRLRDGRLAPTITAGEEELHAIAMGLKEIGKGHLQMVDDFADTTADASTEFEMWRRIVTASGRPLSFNLVQSHSAPDRWKHILSKVRGANEAGLSIKAQVSCRPIGIFLGLDMSSHPFMNSPSYQAIAHLPLAARVAEMRRPEVRARLLSEKPEGMSAEWQGLFCNAAEMVEFAAPLDYFPAAQEKLTVRAAAMGITSLELAYDILLKNDGQGMLHHAVVNYATNDNTVARAMMAHPDTLIGLGDGGAHLGMICDASIPTHLLEYWTRDLPADQRIELPWAISALTRRNAEFIGLRDRGLVAAGMKADLNVLDYDALHLYPPQIVADLPAGGKRLTQSADGYSATILSGVTTQVNGVSTGALPGGLIRGERLDPRTR
ncbi:amidohydrolase family protein [Paraburkholderia sp. BL23I1N1]|uniref:N-acyl-D-amino-acid deacylase family protein n=1 Tax=Paraburkholderia sp. BL23I1N1 TaxID=1938802 RepID=UPI00217DE06D|nr:amidohydrolase family protein [Paraburkholderia sp. BL23I1N1]